MLAYLETCFCGSKAGLYQSHCTCFLNASDRDIGMKENILSTGTLVAVLDLLSVDGFESFILGPSPGIHVVFEAATAAGLDMWHAYLLMSFLFETAEGTNLLSVRYTCISATVLKVFQEHIEPFLEMKWHDRRRNLFVWDPVKPCPHKNVQRNVSYVYL